MLTKRLIYDNYLCIMNKVICREIEISRIQTRLASESTEFVVVYGRRRVGKTWLPRLKTLIICEARYRNNYELSKADVDSAYEKKQDIQAYMKRHKKSYDVKLCYITKTALNKNRAYQELLPLEMTFDQLFHIWISFTNSLHQWVWGKSEPNIKNWFVDCGLKGLTCLIDDW